MTDTLKKQFVKRLISDGSIQFGKQFQGKSGQTYACETDIRLSFTSYGKTREIADILLQLITRTIDDSSYDYFVGVPETGTMIAQFLNERKYERFRDDFAFNWLRGTPKEYQSTTNSINTVLPNVWSSRGILVEDDIVTGKTLLNYLDVAQRAQLHLTGVVTIFSRDSLGGNSLRKTIQQNYGLPFYSIIDITEDFINREGELSWGTGESK